MDIEILKTFLEVRNTRHFSKAAENLYITQSAVSARIKQLEDSFGVKVFTRTRNNLQLTSEGERLVPYIENMLVSWSRAKQDMAIKQEQTRQLSIGTTSGLWNYVFQHRMPLLHQELPEVGLRAMVCANEEIAQLILNRSLDIALSYESITMPELESQPVGKLKLAMFSTRESITVKEALSDNYVFVDWGTAFGIFHARRFGESPPAVLHTNMAAIAESFILEQSGAAYLPEQLTETNSVGRLFRVHDAPTYFRNLYMVYLANTDLAKESSAIRKCLALPYQHNR